MTPSGDEKLQCTIEGILRLIRNSRLPEDLPHAENTLDWVRKLGSTADHLLEIAALGHDVERALSIRKVKRQDFENYDDYKDSHAKHSANIIANIMRDCGWDKDSIKKVFHLVALHEKGGNREADLLRDADSLSFFQVNLPHFYKRNKRDEVVQRCLWGLKRLSPELWPLLEKFEYEDPELREIVKEILISKPQANSGNNSPVPKGVKYFIKKTNSI